MDQWFSKITCEVKTKIYIKLIIIEGDQIRTEDGQGIWFKIVILECLSTNSRKSLIKYIMVQFKFLAKINLKGSILVSNKVKIGQELHKSIMLPSSVMEVR